ncbi:MAG: 5-(carboxyamino)imidazole ribonucleotide synthase [Leptolyngbyaceae cyanobacterium SM1_1_3]|nr:5-(carboxyamino)imidazole ribonucleotide synthase [Leptolyngbyaceae cyanobacterium SM1_1_3]NJN03882.1 5-(carboxyamino)imidazole ribonucleotide synthase [Leptolyngbyaceae cyanobacterium RM1_1_2]NJO08988.1 5-(carboxyamino)imidazole ribonucleotide synthase [Leptolyngbyaceae cyanobacterium SL_1_1]
MGGNTSKAIAFMLASNLFDSAPAETIPARRIGVIGGGQLAWMMAAGAKKLGLELIVQTPQATDPAAAIATEIILAPIDDAAATAELASRCDLITFENEFVNLPALEKLAAQGTKFYPSLAAIKPLLDKYEQRLYLQKTGLPTPRFTALESEADGLHLAEKVAEIGLPLVLKTRRHGYDGQGTFVLKTLTAVEQTWQQLNYAPVLLEEFVPFARELAIMVARSQLKQVIAYPVVETQQVDQVCRRVIATAKVDLLVAEEIGAIARTVMDSLQAVGVFGIEFFLTQDGRVLVNEIAPRTHNSGHYSLDACRTSQFEQHLRAVSGLSLGSPAIACQQAVMVNLLGYKQAARDYAKQRHQLSQIPNAHVYWYGKTESYPGRKLGHVTVLLGTQGQVAERTAADVIQQIESLWYPA